MPVPALPSADFTLVGNLPCLDLVNTEARDRGAPVDRLPDFGRLVDWLTAAGVLSREVARVARDRWDGTAEGKGAWREAIALRAALRIMATRIARGDSPGGEAITAINRVLAQRPITRELVRTGKGYVTRDRVTEESAVQLLAPVAESAAWLVEQGEPGLVRKCEDPECVLFFYDITRNKRRRWCSMEACGSRAKAAAYYRRNRGG